MTTTLDTDLQSRLEEFLSSLAQRGVEGIRAYCQENNIRGRISCPGRCPIAVAVIRELGLPARFTIYAEYAHVTLWSRGHRGGDAQVPTPMEVALFMTNMDDRLYPELIEVPA